VDGITGENEDQKRDEETVSWVSPVHVAGGDDQLTAIVLSLADVEKIKQAAYRAGREDEARSQAAAALDVVMSDGDPAEHNPDWRIGYDRGFVVGGRRADREDAARRLLALLRDHQRYMAWMRDEQRAGRQPVRPFGISEVLFAADYVEAHLTESDQSGDGVQPTEEQPDE